MAQASFVQVGASIDYTPSSAVAIGDVVVQVDLIGVATRAIAANTLGSLAIEGVFEFGKGVLSTDIMPAGTKVYWDDTNNVAALASSGNKYLGKVVEAAVAADTTVKVKLANA